MTILRPILLDVRRTTDRRASLRNYLVSLDYNVDQNLPDQSVLDKYQYSDIPLPSRAIEEDAMYHSHLARIRSLSAFCRLLIASHLFSVVSVCDIRAYMSDISVKQRSPKRSISRAETYIRYPQMVG